MVSLFGKDFIEAKDILGLKLLGKGHNDTVRKTDRSRLVLEQAKSLISKRFIGFYNRIGFRIYNLSTETYCQTMAELPTDNIERFAENVTGYDYYGFHLTVVFR